MDTLRELHKQINFIVGIERSGTSLLNKVLTHHPQIHGIPEATFLVFFLHKYRNRSKFSQDDIELIFKQIHYYYLSNPWVGWEFDISKVKYEVMEVVKRNSLSYIDLCKIIYSYFKVIDLDKTEAICYLDKNPSFTISVNQLKNAIPAAKFIYLVRDYRGNALSKKQVADLKSEGVAFNATRWKLLNKIAWKFYLKNKKDVLLLTYENFVAEPDLYIDRITKHLGVNPTFDWKNDKIKFDTDHTKYNISDKYQKKFEKKYKTLNKEINIDRTEAWKNQLTENEIKICDAICYPFSKRYGIEQHFKLSGMERFFIKLKNIVPILKAYADVYKDRILYRVSPKIKVHRVEKVYKKLGFIPTNANKN